MRTEGAGWSARAALLAVSMALGACGGGEAMVAGGGAQPSTSAGPGASAMHAASETAGHSVSLWIDAAITRPASREDADRIVSDAADVVAHDLARLRRDDPEAFAAEVPRLGRVTCRYGDGGVQPVRWEDTTLVFTRKYRWKVLGDGDVEGALRDDFYAGLARRFANLEPDQVTAPDRADYFVYLVHGTRRTLSREEGEDRVQPATAATVQRVVRLSTLVGESDPRLSAAVRTWLFARADDMASADLAHDTADARQARAAWVAWLNAALPSASPEEKREIATAVYDGNAFTGRPSPTVNEALAGFDTFAFGLSIADSWIAAGHPVAKETDPAGLWHEILEPPVLDAYGRMPRFNYGSSRWLDMAFRTDPQARRLADALGARNDAPLVGAVIYDMPRGDDGGQGSSATPSPYERLLQQLERYPATWRLAMTILIGQGMDYEGCGGVLVDEANRVWREAPALRGTALHAIACSKGTVGGMGDPGFFAQFSHLYGQPIDAALFGSFLDDGADAMRLAYFVWPALSQGWSRAAVLAPRLDAFLSDARVRAGQDEEPMGTLDRLAKQLCGDGPAEVAKLHEALAARAARDVSEGRALAKVLDDTAPGQCKAPRAHASSTAK